MATSLQSTRTLGVTQCFSSRRVVAPRVACRATPVSASQQVSQQQEQVQHNTSRREAVGMLATAAALLTAAPAQAFLGIGEPSENETYTADTTSLLDKVEKFISLEKGDESRGEVVDGLRTDMNSWVAKYRRRGSISGRASFGTSYAIVNALAGSFNSFGNTAPLPKKRLERVAKELTDARRLISRGR
mmetsp:Transcript_5813/g.16618  ORF Transcript_5813/g.16618 Transcript_5813/m.16618 type:complete len:188 (+) Transcript_5813:102-665(+)|eukprot:CAMPEP_0206136158 /NCGR_PEP_ID=MMETSP1473-20131121/1386_1 /ASSEMBLY_ACC=CAM_ASM_001109 /TAXON_ID=1461547 /ORGANISM="Stichococcus sp, Strain RCC1054" /LENGTH=187 /DNA_ID=CAMNT_0053528471 /DNA_START=73 /DNA_END=636 /DNA_ORIENTATION=-